MSNPTDGEKPSQIGTTVSQETRGLTERERLKSLTLAAGLRLSPAELDRLLPLWRRYQRLVDMLRDQPAQDPLGQ